MATADLAVPMFEKFYKEQTGNEWKTRQNFRKLPGICYPIDVTYSNEVETNTTIASRLPPQVEELMKIIFNINNMQITMKKFKLDLEKMPLGKLSELQDAADNGSSNNELVGLSSKFFTLIPHNFKMEKALVLNT
jgi:poly [ADP-ribose] polymerase 1